LIWRTLLTAAATLTTAAQVARAHDAADAANAADNKTQTNATKTPDKQKQYQM
jgi:hypothetical protein